MSVLISSQLKPSYYKRYDVKASAQRPSRAAAKIPNKKARFAEVVNGRCGDARCSVGFSRLDDVW